LRIGFAAISSFSRTLSFRHARMPGIDARSRASSTESEITAAKDHWFASDAGQQLFGCAFYDRAVVLERALQVVLSPGRRTEVIFQRFG
jgi:hypothetical protein